MTKGEIEMAFIESRKKQQGGGGDDAFNPVFSERIIATNNNQSSFTFTEDYHNFDFVKVTTHNVSSGVDTDFITTPSIIDACLSLGAVNFNEYGNNQYVAYSESGLTWSQYGSSRNLYASQVVGMTCENATVSETLIYQASTKTTSGVEVTYSQGSLFDFDLILFGANSSATDEIQPCYYQFSSGIRLMNEVGTAFNVYNSYGAITISEHKLSSHRYVCVVGINFEHPVNPGKITFPQFSETTIATGDSSGVTFTDDWHNYQFINIKSVNTSSNEVTYQLATPAAIDSIFDVNRYLVANEAGTNIYGSYTDTSSTFWELKGTRNMRITEVTGLNCTNGTVTETEIYNKGSYDTSTRTLTGLTDLLSYDMFIICSSKDDIQPNCYYASKGLVFSDQTSFKTIVTPYETQNKITITDTSMSSTYYHYVSGIKFT